MPCAWAVSLFLMPSLTASSAIFQMIVSEEKSDCSWTFNIVCSHVLGTDHIVLKTWVRSSNQTFLISIHSILFCVTADFSSSWLSGMLTKCLLKVQPTGESDDTSKRKGIHLLLNNVEFWWELETVLRQGTPRHPMCSWFWWSPLVMDSSALRVAFWFCFCFFWVHFL